MPWIKTSGYERCSDDYYGLPELTEEEIEHIRFEIGLAIERTKYFLESNPGSSSQQNDLSIKLGYLTRIKDKL